MRGQPDELLIAEPHAMLRNVGLQRKVDQKRSGCKLCVLRIVACFQRFEVNGNLY